MNAGGTSNPLYQTVHMLWSIVSHHFLYGISVIAAIVVLYGTYSYVERMSGFVREIIKKVERWVQDRNTKKLVERYTRKNKNDKNIMILKDIEKHILMLAEQKTRATAMQFLYQYPSPQGFAGLLSLAIGESDQELRIDIICNMCKAVRTNGWYKPDSDTFSQPGLTEL